MTLELLQEIGLNKYEAEAYYTLLTQGPLTGYELGKRSQVPLSRSYDVLERLSQKGLALAQPGEPARYRALEPVLFLGQVRAGMEQTLQTLASSLTTAQQATPSAEFWIVRGRQHILARARTLCMTATHTLQLALPDAYMAELSPSLVEARRRGCRVTLSNEPPNTAHVRLLVDMREALLGVLEPVESCQATLSANPALLAVLADTFAVSAHLSSVTEIDEQGTLSADEGRRDWLEWEKRKQQRLWITTTGQRIA